MLRLETEYLLSENQSLQCAKEELASAHAKKVAELEARTALAKETTKGVAIELEEKEKERFDLAQTLTTEKASFLFENASLSQQLTTLQASFTSVNRKMMLSRSNWRIWNHPAEDNINTGFLYDALIQ